MAAAARDQLNAVAGYSTQKPGKAAALGAYGNDFIDIFAQRVDQTLLSAILPSIRWLYLLRAVCI